MLLDPSWSEQFARERDRLLGVLGALTEGGIVENIQPIGATSVPVAGARPCIDIGLAVWPFPLEAPRQAQLAALGYDLTPGYEAAPEQRFRHVTGDFALHVVEPGSALWTDYLLLRDYLRHDAAARHAYAAARQALAPHALADPVRHAAAKARLFKHTLAQARQGWVRHHGFAPLQAVAEELRALPCAWYIASGWALDLFLGRVTRVHHDVDVVIARSDQLVLQAYLTARGWTFVTPCEGRLEPWPTGLPLELPRHQAHAHRGGAFIDFLLSDIARGLWHYRREPAVTRAAARIGLRTPDGIPFLAPELVLLFKSQNTSGRDRGRDGADYLAVRDHLQTEGRAWLRAALLRTDPAHPWIRDLGSPSTSS